MNLKQKLIALAVILCLLAGAGILINEYLYQRDTAQKIGTKLEIAQDTISEAVDEKKAVSKVSIKHAQKKAVALDSVGRILKEAQENAPITETCPDAVAGDDGTRLFNDTITEVNKLIDDSV